MMDSIEERQQADHAAQELVCVCCGERFLFTRAQREQFDLMGWNAPKKCPSCRKEQRTAREKAAEEAKREAWQQKKAADAEVFNALLKQWPVLSYEEIQPKNDHVLYILGNGFDLMHGVKSSYYEFRDSLGKQNVLRTTLEDYLTPEDIWADFENALAQFDASMMGSRFLVDNWLDDMGAYKPDAGAAEYFMAIEAAAQPIGTIAQELPRRFRMWVESLRIGTKERPLKQMFRKGKVLCFNYTEFVETLYGIPEQNVCYIHGCRRKRKYHPKDRLLLGHMPGASDAAFAFAEKERKKEPDSYRRTMCSAAQAQVMQLIADYDTELTKDCREVIAAHASFFSSLHETEAVVVIGHSFSPVDWDYFSEVAANLPDRNRTHWYFGCHGLRDLHNLEKLLQRLALDRSCISVFRTDAIHAAPLAEEAVKNPAGSFPQEKLRCISPDGRWAVKTLAQWLTIDDRQTQAEAYSVQMPSNLSRTFFFPGGTRLCVVIRGVDPAVVLFHLEDGRWRFTGELESMTNQSLLNPRLQHVFLTDQTLCFVYRNRVRKYSLLDGALLENRAQRNAESCRYEGTDIRRKFLRRT